MKTSGTMIAGLSLLAIWPAMARAELCSSIRSAQERLACFDREASRAPENKRQTSGTVPNPEKPVVDPVDWLKAENEKLSMRLKGICRGC